MMENPGNRIDDLASALQEAATQGPLLELPSLSGLSGGGVIGALQRLARIQEEEGDYLEVGVYQGLTLCSVAAVLREGKAIGIDDFSQFDPDGTNQGTVLAQLQRFRLENAHLIDADFERALQTLDERMAGRQVGLYFIDGPHDYRSQLMCLMHVLPHLSPHAVIVIDDANYPHVRQATRDFLATHPEFKLLMEAYTPCHPKNMTPLLYDVARKGWWNGVHVLYRDVDDHLASQLPPGSDLDIMRNEHVVHGSAGAVVAPEAAALTASLRFLDPVRAMGRLVRLAWRVRRLPVEKAGEFRTMNTYSASLPPVRWNPTLVWRRTAGAEEQ